MEKIHEKEIFCACVGFVKLRNDWEYRKSIRGNQRTYLKYCPMQTFDLHRFGHNNFFAVNDSGLLSRRLVDDVLMNGMNF